MLIVTAIAWELSTDLQSFSFFLADLTANFDSCSKIIAKFTNEFATAAGWLQKASYN